VEIDFYDGVNILIGENGTGKNHLLKLLYTFCKAANSRAKPVAVFNCEVSDSNW